MSTMRLGLEVTSAVWSPACLTACSSSRAPGCQGHALAKQVLDFAQQCTAGCRRTVLSRTRLGLQHLDHLSERPPDHLRAGGHRQLATEIGRRLMKCDRPEFLGVGQCPVHIKQHGSKSVLGAGCAVFRVVGNAEEDIS
jgi:hypothetical protein